MARAAERRALTSASFLPWALHCTILVHFYSIAQFLYSSCTLLVQLKERGNLFVLVAPPEPISPKLFSRTPWPSKPWFVVSLRSDLPTESVVSCPVESGAVCVCVCVAGDCRRSRM